LPDGIASPYAIAICAEEGPLLFWSKDSQHSHSSTLYDFDLHTRAVHELLKGDYGDILCSPRPHKLCVQLRRNDTTTLVILRDTGEKIGELENPEQGVFFFPQWSADGRYIVYEGSDPNRRSKSPNAFNALGALDIAHWRDSLFPINRDAFGHRVLMHEGKTFICIARNDFDEPQRWKFEIRDLHGAPIKMPDDVPWRLCTAQNRRYYVSGQFEVPLAFRIFRAETRQVVVSFPGVDPKTNEIIVAGSWNPTTDELIAIEGRDNGNELQSVAILRLSDSKVVKRLKTSAYSWAPSGKCMIYFQDRKFVFERTAL
jgi:hypothetical protein